MVTISLTKAYLDGTIKLDSADATGDATGDSSIDPNRTANSADASSSGESNLSGLTEKLSNSTLAEEADSEEEQIRKYSQNLPEQLPLDRDNDWPVMVLSVTNRKELVVRLTDNTEQLDELIADLQKFYNTDRLGKPVHDLIINRVYAAVFAGKCAAISGRFGVVTLA